jgi:ABC-type antimicrobial peptide transport system permease subunit
MRPLEHSPLVYLALGGGWLSSVSLLASTAISPVNLVEPFRRAVQSLDENLPTQDIATLDERVSRRRLNVSVFGTLFTVFAASALLLAWVGLYAVVVHAVTRRTQEIGIRVAMGGSNRDIVGLVLRQGMA